MQPKISVITVCYNSEAHLEEAILSVVNQSYQNKEYIIIDGGSTDGTLSIIEKYRDKIDYFVSEPDNGISDAFNKGIRAATGDVICICNSDDVLADNVLMCFIPYYDGQTEVYRLDETIKDFKTGEEFRVSPTIYLPKLPFTSTINHMGCYITKVAYLKYGLYDTNFKYCMDLELIRRFTYRGAKFKHVPINCGYFRRGGVSSSGEKNMRVERRLVVLQYGGNKIEAFLFISFFFIKQMFKNLFNIFGENSATYLKTKFIK